VYPVMSSYLESASRSSTKQSVRTRHTTKKKTESMTSKVMILAFLDRPMMDDVFRYCCCKRLG
jgi:hypothetical protein